MPTGAQLIVDLLEERGVEVCFGLPGVHNLALWEALRGSSIRLVGVRHEQAAAYAADGYARASGRLGVALTTTGPGAANTLAAVGEAWASRSPVLVIATDIPSTLRRPGAYRGVLHETTDQAAMFAPVVKGVHRALAVGDVHWAASIAISDVLTPPHRPVYLELATDLLGAPASRDTVGYAPWSAPSPGDALEDAVARLAAAERPLLWAGTGARDAGEPVTRLAERLAAPVIVTYGAAGLLPPTHPCLVGMPPHVEPAGSLWDEADLVLAIGSDLDGVQTQNFAMPQPPALVAVNLDAEDAAKNYRVDVLLEGDAAEVTAALVDRLPERRGARARSPSACTRSARAPARNSTSARCGSSTPSTSRCPRTPSWWRTCASPVTGWPASTRRRRRGGCRSRSAGGRSATRSRRRSARPWRVPARRWRSPATAASCSRAASWRPWRRSGSR